MIQHRHTCHFASPILVGIILGHMVLALWEGGMSPFPLHPAVAATEVFFSLCYATHILLNLWTFGVKQYRLVATVNLAFMQLLFYGCFGHVVVVAVVLLTVVS